MFDEEERGKVERIELCDIKFKWTYCRYFWEAHVELKDVPLAILNEWDKEEMYNPARKNEK